MKNLESRIATLIAKCWTDPKFRARFLRDPKQVIAEAVLGVTEDVQIVVVQDTPTKRHIVLPAAPPDGFSTRDLDDAAWQLMLSSLALYCAPGDAAPHADPYCAPAKHTPLYCAPMSAETELYCAPSKLSALYCAPMSAEAELYCAPAKHSALYCAPMSAETELYCAPGKNASLYCAPSSPETALYCAPGKRPRKKAKRRKPSKG
jgi:hypothetical protein